MQQVEAKIDNQTCNALLNPHLVNRTDPQHRKIQNMQIHLIEHKLYFWIDELMEQVKSLKDKAKSIETKKNTITESQINAFKDELTKELILINQRK